MLKSSTLSYYWSMFTYKNYYTENIKAQLTDTAIIINTKALENIKI